MASNYPSDSPDEDDRRRDEQEFVMHLLRRLGGPSSSACSGRMARYMLEAMLRRSPSGPYRSSERRDRLLSRSEMDRRGHRRRSSRSSEERLLSRSEMDRRGHRRRSSRSPEERLLSRSEMDRRGHRRRSSRSPEERWRRDSDHHYDFPDEFDEDDYNMMEDMEYEFMREMDRPSTSSFSGRRRRERMLRRELYEDMYRHSPWPPERMFWMMDMFGPGLGMHSFLHRRRSRSPEQRDTGMPKIVITQSPPQSDDDSDGTKDTDFKNNLEEAKFFVPDRLKLLRLLIVGGVTKLTHGDEPKKIDDFSVVNKMIKEGNGVEVVDLLTEVSESGRSARQQYLMYSLALCCRSDDVKTRQAGYAAVMSMCRIPTHLFLFISMIEGSSNTSGWGRGMRRAVCEWYNQFASDPMRLVKLITKYKTRHGWSHCDVFRLSHIKPANDVIGFIVRYAVKGMKAAEDSFLSDGYLDNEQLEKVHKYLKVAKEAKSCDDVPRAVELIKEYDLVREQLSTHVLNQPEIWAAMLPNMPLTALIRNVNKMTELGLFSNYENVDIVVKKLSNKEALRKARVHPLNLYLAYRIYHEGSGDKGSLEWKPNETVEEALQEAFYLSFDSVEPTHQRILIALDVSASMDDPLPSAPQVSMFEVTAALTMIAVKTEPNCDIVCFKNHLKDFAGIKRCETLFEYVSMMRQVIFGRTDCSKPMTWARKKKKKYDAFIIYTDNDTNCQKIPPWYSLDKYRKAMEIPNAKLVVVGMKGSDFTIARPSDVNSLDVVGFDASTPTLINEFLLSKGE